MENVTTTEGTVEPINLKELKRDASSSSKKEWRVDVWELLKDREEEVPRGILVALGNKYQNVGLPVVGNTASEVVTYSQLYRIMEGYCITCGNAKPCIPVEG
jgi:hypothetical protein